MARWTEDQIIARISTALNDPSTAIWGTATIAAQMGLDIRLMSEEIPQLAKATVAFASTARELSLASLADWIEIEAVEFPVDKHPRRYVTFSLRGSSVILDDYDPSVSTTDTAYIWYSAPHTVSGTATNTFKANEEEMLVELTACHLLLNVARDRRESINTGGGDVDSKYIADAERREARVMSRLHQAGWNAKQNSIQSNMNIRWPDVK